jgi:trimeric autotransporter adhesin
MVVGLIACGDNAAKEATTIVVTPNNVSVEAGGTVEVAASYQFGDGMTQAADDVSWTSSDASIATVTPGTGGRATVRGVKTGMTTIRVSGGGVSATVAVTVGAARVLSIAVTPTTPSLAAGTTTQLTAIATLSDTTTANVTGMVEWSSATVATAAVSATGLLSAKVVGTAVISAKLGAVTGSTTATVTAALLRTIQVTPAAQDLALGIKLQLTATGTFSDNTTQDLTTQVTWTSSDGAKATVAPTGLVTGAGIGAATITATKDGISGSTTVNVTAAVLLSIAIDPPTLSVARGRTLQLTATGTFSDASTQNLTAQVTWTSSVETVATIDAAGLVTSVDPGTTEIKATLGVISATKTLTVTAAELVAIDVAPVAPSVALGRSVQFAAAGRFSDNTTQPLTDQVLWASSDATVAEISNAPGSQGKATTLKVGETTISATLTGITGSTTLTVTDAVLDFITVTPVDPSLAVGRELPFQAVGTFSNNTTQDLTTQATWASSDEIVATVSTADPTRGLAKALNVGTTTISAAVGTTSGSSLLTVTAAVLDSIAVDPPLPSVALGRSQQFKATGTFSDNTTQDLTDQVTWASSIPTIASISNADGSKGLASTHSVGDTVISATLDGVTGETTLTVTAAVLVEIQVTPATPSLAKGTSLQFKATGVFSNNTTQDLTKDVAWSSSDEAVATISNTDPSQGLAAALTVGTTTITAALGTVSGSTLLTVTDAVLVSIEVTPAAISLAVGRDVQFAATGVFSDDSTQVLTDAVTWASSADLVAKISNTAGSKGLATALAVGETTISASFGGVTGQTTLTVTAAELETITVTAESATLAKGRSLQFTATGTFSDDTTQDLTKQVTWASSAEAVALVSNADPTQGLALAVNVGVTVISATLDGLTGDATLEVTAAVLDSITVEPIDPSIIQGLTQQFTATGTFSDATTLNITDQVLWASSDDAVATISNAVGSQGLASGLTAGTTTISAALTGVTGSTTLTVTAAVLESITVTTTNATVGIGQTRQFTATGSFNNGTTQNITTQVLWESSDAVVALISNADGTQGLATALAAGTATISATLNGVTGSATLTVVLAAAGNLVINEVDYDQPGTDTTEYVEILNRGNAPVSLVDVQLVLVNGNGGAVYQTIDLTGLGLAATIAPQQRLVLGPALVLDALPAGVLKIDTGWGNNANNAIQNGAPDGLALIDAAAHTLIDALSYEGSITAATIPGFAGPVSLVEGIALPGTGDAGNGAASLCRSPDGTDTNNATTDWKVCTLTPGAANP